MPLVERSVYWSILLKADIGLVSLGKNMKSHNLPLKMMGYMQLSKPILASVNNDNEIIQLIVENNIGLVSEASDVKNFNINLNSIISNEQARRLQGENSFKLFNNRFTVKHAAKQIYTHFI
jgi:O26-antigen biosynthesis N-acetyl-L-fucosamine transferase